MASSTHAAVIAGASLIVRCLRPAVVRSFWLDIQPEPMDRVDIVIIRYRPSAAAISRAEEFVHGWLLASVKDEEHRIVLGKWAMCRAAPRVGGAFRDFCQKTGRFFRTAERRRFKMNFKAFERAD